MENDLRKLFFISFIASTVLLSGCGVKDELERRNFEISRLNHMLQEQYGTRAADLDFAEHQVGIYRGCTFLFNVCSADTTVAAEKLIKNGFTGSSSIWWWFAFMSKLTGVAAFIGLMLWLPWHLFVLFTRPVKAKFDDAQKMISGLNEKVDDANRKRTQTLQQASVMKKDFQRLSADVTKMKKLLTETENAASQALSLLNAAKVELAEITSLKESFRQF